MKWINKVQRRFELYLARKHNLVILVDVKGRKLDPVKTLNEESFSVGHQFPFLIMSTPECRPPEEFNMKWEDIMEGHPDAERILETLQRIPLMGEKEMTINST